MIGEIAPQTFGVGRHQNLFGVRRHRERNHRQSVAAVDPDAPQHRQRDNPWQIRTGPAAGVWPVGRGIVAEIGREQHGARKQVLDRRCGNPQGETATGGVTDQGQRRLGAGLANHRNEISEIVLELADIADIAARTRRAMAANTHGEGLHAARCQRVGQRMNAGARPGGAVH